VLKEIQGSVDSLAYVPGTHDQSSFDHLIVCDAGYYSYQWALALSRDVLTRLKKEGLLNPTTAAAWRDDVLSKGGGVDEETMVANFLGGGSERGRLHRLPERPGLRSGAVHALSRRGSSASR
jgi:oligopeptidase A